MKLDPNLVAPSQDFLKPQTISHILKCIKEGREKDLPPPPIVRQDSEGNYIAVDGHNLLAVDTLLGRKTVVHLAVSPTDGLLATSDANRKRNADLSDKYESCLLERNRLIAEGVKSFRDLIAKYPDAFQ